MRRLSGSLGLLLLAGSFSPRPASAQEVASPAPSVRSAFTSAGTTTPGGGLSFLGLGWRFAGGAFLAVALVSVAFLSAALVTARDNARASRVNGSFMRWILQSAKSLASGNTA